MWLLLLMTAHAAPRVETADAWAGTTLVFSGLVTKYRPVGVEAEDGEQMEEADWGASCTAPAEPTRPRGESPPRFEAEEWPVKCISPVDGPVRCWDTSGPHDGKADPSLGTQAEWDAWVENNSLEIGSNLLATSTASFGVRMERSGRDEPEVVDGAAEFVLGCEGSGSYSVHLTRGDLSWVWDRTAEVTSGGVYSKTLDIKPYWSRDDKRLAVLESDRGGRHDGGPIPPTVRIHHASTTLLTVMAHPTEVSAEAFKRASTTVARDTGLVFQRSMNSKRLLQQSVVYFAEGYREQAEAAAKAVPGGATVERLTWRTHSKHARQSECQHLCGQPDLILELGTSVE